MPVKFSGTKHVICLFLLTWVVTFSLCGVDAFIPAFLGLPHHSSHSVNVECEKACLASSITHHDAVIGQTAGLSFQTGGQSAVSVIHASSEDTVGLFHLGDTPTRHPASVKRYQLLSTYRL